MHRCRRILLHSYAPYHRYNIPEDLDVGLIDAEKAVLVTGACGHIGTELCRVLRRGGQNVVPVDINSDGARGVVGCDIRSKDDLARLFHKYSVSAVIHLAGVLPSAFNADPLLGAEVNVDASVELMRQSAAARVKRFIFASSMSIYGTRPTSRPSTEDDPAVPQDAYGGSKRAVELIGEALGKNKAFEFVALRIARVVGPGIKKTSSPWRAQIFEGPDSICLPFSPNAKLSIVHACEIARMFLILVEAPETKCCFYNTPVETWEVEQLKQAIEEVRGIRVELGPESVQGGPLCDGRRFAREFGFQLGGVREYLERSP